MVYYPEWKARKTSMSAFIVNDQTINQVVTGIDLRHSHDYLRRKVRAMFPGSDWQRDFGNALFTMNCEAVNQRYGTGEAAQFRELDHTFSYAPAPAVQVYKSACCLRYQCTEGDVPESALYKLLEEITRALAHEIVVNLPAYESAAWG
jgi:hypothetical protein